MENIGDYIYLVVIVVVGLISALRKKKAVKVVQPEAESDEDDIFDIEEVEDRSRKYTIEAEDDFWKDVIDVETDIEKVKPVYFNSESEGTFGEPLAAEFSNEGVSALNIENGAESGDITESRGNFAEQLDEESLGGRISRDFNLKEAIVFSEILNRREDF
jgi:hypothetical protein